MAVNKKGVFFTLTAIMFISILILFIEIEHKPRLSEKIDVVNQRVSTMNSFITSVEEDGERSLYISSFRTFLAMTDYMITHNEYIDNLTLRFTEAFFDGTIKNEPNAMISGSTFDDWIDSINYHANRVNIITEFDNPVVAIYQEDPWSVNVNLNVTIKYYDLDNVASWNRFTVINSRLNITSFEDPVYIVNTIARVSNPLSITPYEDNYTTKISETEWDVKNLKDHLKNSYYTYNPDAPSYLMRLEGALSQDSPCCGIESLVNLEELDSQGLPVFEYSVVDHEYWSNISGVQIRGMQSWFRLDSAHRTKYQVSDDFFIA